MQATLGIDHQRSMEIFAVLPQQRAVLSIRVSHRDHGRACHVLPPSPFMYHSFHSLFQPLSRSHSLHPQVLLPLLRASDALLHVRVVNVALRDAGFEAIAAFVAHATSVRVCFLCFLNFFFFVFVHLPEILGLESGIGIRDWI